MGEGDFKQFIVEILLRARDEVSKIAGQAAQSLNKVTDAQKQSTAEQSKATKASKDQSRALDELVAAHTREKKGAKESAAAIRELARDRETQIKSIKDTIDEINREIRTERASSTERQRQHVQRVSQLRAEAAELEKLSGSSNDYTKQLKREATALSTSATQESSASQRRVSVLGKEVAAHRNNVESMRSEAQQLHRLASEREKDRGALSRFFSDLRQGARDADVNLAKLGSSFRGFQVAFVIKYAQALVSALTALAGEFFSVASSAVQAGAALAGSFVAGAAQALPVIGALVAAFARVAAVIKAVQLNQQNSLTSTRSQTTLAEAQRNASERVRSALEAERDAHRKLNEAIKQRNVTLREAKAEYDDIIAKEKEARQAAIDSSLSVEEAQARLRQAIRGGGSTDVAEAQSNLADARLSRSSAQRDVGTATTDASFARRTGMSPDGAKRLADAEKQVAQAQRDSARAARQVTEARHDAGVATEKQASGDDRLAQMLAQLSPVERELYKSILRIQDVFKRNVRPITDIIVDSFRRGVDRGTKLLEDNRVLAGFRRVATAIAGVFDKLTKIGSSDSSVNFFTFLTKQIQRNAPIITSILTKVFGVFKNIARAGAPAFRDLLKLIDQFAGKAKKSSENTKGLSDFFRMGIRQLHAWIDLALSAINLFLALSGAGGAKEGFKSLKSATDYLNNLADSVRHNRSEVGKFFSEARESSGKVFGVLAALGKEIINVFSPANVDAFASFLTKVLIPAVGNVLKILGTLTTVAHLFLSLPIVSDLAQWALTFLAVGKAVQIFAASLKAMRLVAIAFVESNPLLALIVGLAALVLVLDRRFHFLAPTLAFLQRVGKQAFAVLKNAAQDAFGWITKAAHNVGAYFSDVWTQGLLKWLRWPFEKFFGFLDKIGVWDAITGAAEKIIGFFGDGGVWSTLGSIIFAPYKIAFRLLKAVFGNMKDIVEIFLDIIAGRFDKVGGKIADIWYRTFSTIYSIIVDVINAIVSAVNTVIGAFNKLPGPNIGKIGLHLNKMAVSRESAKTLSDAKAGKTDSNYAGPHETGGWIGAKPGGRYAQVGEAGHDEVILTTDPKHAANTNRLLSEFLGRTSSFMGRFAKGGWVQGAVPTPAGHPVTGLARALFAKGFSATSGVRNTSTYHGSGDAVDWGDSVNNIRSLWRILFPLRRGFAELGGPSYVSHGRWWKFGVPENIAGSALQRQHENHIHVAIVTAAQALARRIGAALGGNIGAAVGLAGMLPKGLTQSVRSLLGRNPAGHTGSFASGALGAVYRMAGDSIRSIQGRAAGLAGMSSGFDDSATASGSGAALMRKISRQRRWDFNDWWALDASETSHGANLSNPTSSARLRGQFLDMNWGSYGPGSDPRLHPTMGQQIVAMARYIAQRYHNPTKAWAFHRAHNYYAKGGAIPGFGGGDRYPAMLEGGEHVFSKEEVTSAGGHSVLRALRTMLGGGGQGGHGRYQTGGRVAGSALGAGIGRLPGVVSSAAFSDELEQILSIFNGLTRSTRKGKNIAKKIRSAFGLVFEDGGLFSQIGDQIDAISGRRAARLQRRQFGVSGDRFVRRDVSATAVAQFGVGTLTRQRGVLEDEGTALDAGLRAARRARTQALRRGNKKAAAQAKSEINRILGLQTQLQSALAQNLQDVVEAQEAVQQAAVDNINNNASRALGANDIRQRLAQIGGTNYNLMGSALQQRGDIIRGQIGSLSSQLNAAQASGNVALVDTLKDQLADLNASLAENTQAIKDNTDAAFDARVAAINNAAGFQQSVFGSAIAFFQNLSKITGQDTSATVAGLLGSQAGSLDTQRGGLLGALGDLLGYSPDEKAGIAGLQGTDLVNYILSIASGPMFDSIMAGLDPAQQEAFQGLISALLANASATEDNTSATQEATGQTKTQSFSSSWWQTFRAAIFSGNGDLLPQFSVPPVMDDGLGVAKKDGMYFLRMGERVTWPGRTDAAGDTYITQITSPTEVADPADIGHKIAFHRRTRGR